MEAFGLLLHGFAVLMTWKTLALMMVGLVLGIFVGVLPGLGGPNGVAILLPLTFTMDPTSAIVMLSCIYWGALFGGAITSILFNIPGEAWSVATTFDGYPMAQQGQAAEALTAAFTSSFIGSLVAVLLITFLAPVISSFALKFGPPEFFAVYLLTFCSFVGLGREDKHKTVISMALGLLLAGVGMDTVSGQLRMTFGSGRCNAPITASSRSGRRSRWPRCSARSDCRAAVSVSATAAWRVSRVCDRMRRRRRCRWATIAVRDFIPVARIADLLLNPGAPFQYDGQDLTIPISSWCTGAAAIRSIIIRIINRLIRAWRRPDTVIVNEAFWTATARHSDIVLPATTNLERNDLGAASRDRFIIAMKQAIAPVGRARNDFDTFSDLAERFELRDLFTEMRTEMEWVRYLYDTASEQAAKSGRPWIDFDEFWERGYFEMPAALEADRAVRKIPRQSESPQALDAVGTHRDFFREDCRLRL